MKNLTNNLITAALLGSSAMRFGRRSNRNRLRRMWNPGRTPQFTGPYRRKRNTYGLLRPLEINKAVGGTKSLRYNGPKITQVINFYAKIRFNPNNADNYEFFYDDNNFEYYDLKAQLNDSDEFLTLRKQAIQYNIRQVALSFNYNRVPQAKEKWSKMILTPESDKIERSDFQINNNAMIWDMTTNGTKNYNFRVNRTNTDDEDAGWIIGQAQFNGILKIWIDSQGSNYVPPEQYTFDKQLELGEIKISVQIVYYHKDISDVNNKIVRTRFTTKELLQPLLEKKIEEEKQKQEFTDVE